jgi:hypothetical protein
MTSCITVSVVAAMYTAVAAAAIGEALTVHLCVCTSAASLLQAV